MKGVKVAVKLRVRGQVHGVSFRASLTQRADSEKIAGWVRNAADGSVEALLEGEEDSVGRLLEWAKRGPPNARVDSVDVTRIGVQSLKGFRIVG